MAWFELIIEKRFVIFPEFKALLQRLYHNSNTTVIDFGRISLHVTSQFSGGKRANDISFK